MRKLQVLLMLALGCASSAGAPRLRVELMEPYAQGAPEQTQDFEAEASIFLSPRRSPKDPVIFRVESLQVIIDGTGPAGNFVESGTYSIIHERLPG